jgi:hypothetical protein
MGTLPYTITKSVTLFFNPSATEIIRNIAPRVSRQNCRDGGYFVTFKKDKIVKRGFF